MHYAARKECPLPTCSLGTFRQVAAPFCTLRTPPTCTPQVSVPGGCGLGTMLFTLAPRKKLAQGSRGVCQGAECLGHRTSRSLTQCKLLHATTTACHTQFERFRLCSCAHCRGVRSQRRQKQPGHAQSKDLSGKGINSSSCLLYTSPSPRD